MNKKFMAYIRLVRLDKPTGILLLWFPTSQALWLACHGKPQFFLIGLFFLGTIIMRSAGCIINDIADRKIDRYVSRTRSRPLVTGELTLANALTLLIILLMIALIILVRLPLICWYYAIFSLAIVIIYPYCKRFFKAPQLILGIAFSMSIPMTFAAASAIYDTNFWLLIIINFLWVIAYDTEYAMTDKQDDKKLGIYSTAILFGAYDKWVILCLQLSSYFLWLILLQYNQYSKVAFEFWLIAGANIAYQQYLIKDRNPKNCLKAFHVNNGYGLLLWLSLI